ncbi:MAG TPA: lysophospholipid acyltransferase family protein [Terriglobales bacterium]|nr:lysophospholipid acyltransferase family protein [Terriglobales bacterium]
MATTTASVDPQPPAPQGFTLKQRFSIWLVTWVGYLSMRLIGPTLRWQSSIEEGGPATISPERTIYVFWHRAVFSSTWFYRNRGISVITSSSFDGEYIARIIEKLGYKAVRGSSSRNAVRALLGLHTEIEEGRSVGFTIDGPRGPRYVAKPGPVLLARNTKAPIMPFYTAIEKGWVLKSWDRFVIPKPFSRAHLRIGRLIHVPKDTSSEQAQQLHAEMQAALDRVREYAEAQLPHSNTRA